MRKDTALFSEFNTIPIKIEHYQYDQFNAIIQDPSFDGAETLRFSFHINEKGEIDKLTETPKGFSVQFEENDKGEILSCSFIQPNGTFKATKKK